MDEVSNLASGIISKTLARNEIRFSLNGIILLRSENALHLECGCKGAHLIVQMHVVSPQGKLKN